MPNLGTESLPKVDFVHGDQIGRRIASGRVNSVNYGEFLVDRDFLTLLRSRKPENFRKKRETTAVSPLN